jgi:serine/threonine kinase 16
VQQEQNRTVANQEVESQQEKNQEAAGTKKMIDSLFRFLNALWKWMLSLWQSQFGPVLTMDDSGIRVRVGFQIAEGGFSVIFHATNLDAAKHLVGSASASANQHQYEYVLKRIRCHDGETRSGCIQESKAHYAVMGQQQQQQRQMHSSGSILAAGGGVRGGGIASSTAETIRDSLSGHIMPLLGMTFGENNTLCYMLFPYLPHSLKKEVVLRIFEPMEEVTNNTKNKNGSTMSQTQKNQKIKDSLRMPPWSETTVLRWFEQLCDSVILMHASGYTHRDIKLDNVLLQQSSPSPSLSSFPEASSGNGNNNVYRGRSTHDSRSGVVLMDYGSAGPLHKSLGTRRDVLEIADEASQNTTISYRPPELFAGELRAVATGSATNATNAASTFTDVDGDEVFHHESVLDYRKVDVWMLGCTLFAILFGASPGESEFSRSTGQLLIVDPSHNKMLGQMPPWPSTEMPSARWYSAELKELLAWILTKDRGDRPTVKAVRRRVREILSQKPSLFVGDGDDARMNV